MNKPNENLIKAAELLARKGWCRGEFKSHGRRCILGAIDEISPFATGAEQTLFTNFLANDQMTTQFNDSTCTGRAQAIDMLIGAAIMNDEEV